MRISVNLATRPFVELRPFFARLRIVMGALAVAAIVLFVVTHSMQKKLDRAQAQMDALKARTAAAQNEKINNERQMRQPANAAVLARSHFLNQLFLRKSFSWTAVMMDLETVLPVGVQVTSIEPQPTADGDLVIRLRVAGDRDRAVQLVRNLERSKRFIAPRLSGENSQAKEGANAQMLAGAPAGVEFEIMANYNPLPAGVAYEKPKAAVDETTAGGAKPGSARPHGAKPAVVRPGPHDGIVLKPYVAPRPGVVTRPAAGTPKGGAR